VGASAEIFRTQTSKKHRKVGKIVVSKHIVANEVTADAGTLLAIWKANPDMKIKDLTLPAYEKAGFAFEEVQTRYTVAEREYTNVTTERNILGGELNRMNVHVRAAIRGYFGPDSPEYEKAGGTRASDRRRPARRTAAEPASAEATSGNGK
jgi:hypothetical protein